MPVNIVMKAVVNLKEGDKLLFTPTPEAMTGKDRKWSEFCRARISAYCEVLEIEVPEEITNLRTALGSFMGPILLVRFLNGEEHRIAAQHFTVPKRV